MFRGTLGCLLVVCLTAGVTAQNLEKPDDGLLYDDEGRLLIVTLGTGATPLSLNFTNIFTTLLQDLAPFLAGAGLAALGFGIPSAFLWGKGCYGSGSGYSGSGYGNSGGYSSYSSYRR